MVEWDDYGVMDKDGIQVGDKIVCPHLLGWSNAVVMRDEGGKLYAENDAMGFVLEYVDRRDDEYKCWVSGHAWNRKGLERLTIKR